jgi:uncharacterized RDD family membrane protein YckC
MTDQPPPGSYPPPAGPSGSSPGGQQPPPPPGGAFPPPAPSAPPPPDGGSYPPPPPSAGGYAPPPPGPAVRALPTESYTPWVTRVLAYLIDYIPVAVVYGIGWVIALVTQDKTCVGGVTQYEVNPCAYAVYQDSTIGVLAQGLASLLIFAYVIWNNGYRQGTTGSSIGKSVMKFKVVSETTGQPIGFGMSVVRQLAHFVDAIICYVGFLFPLWDSKRQTLADKIMTTVCLPL